MEYYYFASAVTALISGGIGLYAGRTGQRRSELELRIRELEERIWQVAPSAEEYWNLDQGENELRGLEIEMKNLSVRIGSDIVHLNSHYRSFLFEKSSLLLALRQAAASSPFEEKDRQADLQRGDEIRQAAYRLVHEISIARRYTFVDRVAAYFLSIRLRSRFNRTYR